MSSAKDNTGLRRAEVRDIFREHRGAAAAVARELGVTAVSVSHVVRGKLTSPRILAACEAKARELLKQEASSEAA